MRRVLMIGAFAAGLAPVPSAPAQQGGQSDMSSMPNTAPNAQVTGKAPAMDMDAMMTRCAQMRRDIKPDAPMTADMRKMMADCDAMDKEMGAGSTTAPAQPYAPPAERSR
jgi:hypothetical protein